MANVKSRREQAIGVIDEYLRAAKICIDTMKPDGSMLGYPATLLLLCATDAIGNGVKSGTNGDTRLDVLATSLFNNVLHTYQVKHFTEWYRNLLAHTATLAVGVHLEPDAQGQVFEFHKPDAPVLIRVAKLYEVVSDAWKQVKDTAIFNPPPERNRAKSAAGWVSSLSPAASGVVSIAGQ